MMRRWIGKKTPRGLIRAIRSSRRPKDIIAQQKKVRQADALAFIAPVYFVGFPAILKGWIERVFCLGFAFSLKPEARRGDISGRLPLLTHRKALILSTTFFDERSYASSLGPAMKTLIDDFAFRYPGIKTVEHAYFYAVNGADAATRQAYLDRAFHLGKTFDS